MSAISGGRVPYGPAAPLVSTSGPAGITAFQGERSRYNRTLRVRGLRSYTTRRKGVREVPVGGNPVPRGRAPRRRTCRQDLALTPRSRANLGFHLFPEELSFVSALDGSSQQGLAGHLAEMPLAGTHGAAAQATPKPSTPEKRLAANGLSLSERTQDAWQPPLPTEPRPFPPTSECPSERTSDEVPSRPCCRLAHGSGGSTRGCRCPGRDRTQADCTEQDSIEKGGR
jgi:hypothetical protein